MSRLGARPFFFMRQSGGYRPRELQTSRAYSKFAMRALPAGRTSMSALGSAHSRWRINTKGPRVVSPGTRRIRTRLMGVWDQYGVRGCAEPRLEAGAVLEGWGPRRCWTATRRAASGFASTRTGTLSRSLSAISGVLSRAHDLCARTRRYFEAAWPGRARRPARDTGIGGSPHYTAMRRSAVASAWDDAEAGQHFAAAGVADVGGGCLGFVQALGLRGCRWMGACRICEGGFRWSWLWRTRRRWLRTYGAAQNLCLRPDGFVAWVGSDSLSAQFCLSMFRKPHA